MRSVAALAWMQVHDWPDIVDPADDSDEQPAASAAATTAGRSRLTLTLWHAPCTGRSVPARCAQRRRITVTTLPNTVTSLASNTIGLSRAFDGTSVTVLPLRL